MGTRLELQTLLETLLGSENVYFQPPESILIEYPCIVYERSDIDVKRADNVLYTCDNQYQITVIDPNPDSLIPMKIMSLSKCQFNRHFVTDGLNHDVFILFY